MPPEGSSSLEPHGAMVRCNERVELYRQKSPYMAVIRASHATSGPMWQSAQAFLYGLSTRFLIRVDRETLQLIRMS